MFRVWTLFIVSFTFIFIVIEMWKWRRLKMVHFKEYNNVVRFELFGANSLIKKWAKKMRWPNWLAGNNNKNNTSTMKKKIHLRILFVFYCECCVLISSAMPLFVSTSVSMAMLMSVCVALFKNKMRHKRRWNENT